MLCYYFPIDLLYYHYFLESVFKDVINHTERRHKHPGILHMLYIILSSVSDALMLPRSAADRDLTDIYLSKKYLRLSDYFRQTEEPVFF